ncbi:MAG: glucosidase [Planctomycetes bacterium]|nr:glucosidase [Planctomycetota bacterium]
MAQHADAERARLAEDEARTKNWKRFGPYLAERQWGTVREDYSKDGECWDYFPFEQSHLRAYRWGEDGLLGITDRECRICFAVALWNGKDPVLKERLYGLNGKQGNHGEDVKEVYHYLDSTPTHSFMRAQYSYPQAEFPYARLREENARRNREQREFELADTGVFAESRWFDVIAEYAKASPDDLLIRIRVVNRGPERAKVHVLPQLWFRNTWSWGDTYDDTGTKPSLRKTSAHTVIAEHPTLGTFQWCVDSTQDGRTAPLLFTENDSNVAALFQTPNESPYTKDAFHDVVVRGLHERANPRSKGTKAAAWFALEIEPGATQVLRLRLRHEQVRAVEPFGEAFDDVFAVREAEADAFFATVLPPKERPEERRVARQAYAGLLWSKQFYHYVVADWLAGDPAQPRPPKERSAGRNADWPHLFNRDVISMPDKWEYPWYAAWDLAFHTIPFARIDPAFAKDQLLLFLREWYMHPNGQIPAYEWNFSDVNPPVHAWAAWRVYKMTGKRGARDRAFLARVFQKLLINFTWWVNRKDLHGKHVFAGGFLGLDNIGVFDRSKPLPKGGHLEQADGTAWMAFYCLTMLAIALELAQDDPAAEDMASKFFEHFVAIVDAMNTLNGSGLWDPADGFYYDLMHCDGHATPIRVRSMVGLIPLFAAEVLDEDHIANLHGFKKRMAWFLKHRSDLARHIAFAETDERSSGRRRLLAVVPRSRLERMLKYLLDENEFLSPYGVRSLSKIHATKPFVLDVDGEQHRVDYQPGESNSGLFGGNSNWRGPIWFPLNYLLIEALERHHHFYGDDLKVEFPTGSGRKATLLEVARELGKRLTRLFLPDERGRRPCHANDPRYGRGGDAEDLVLFHEYFHGDTGEGLGASHQTGWTALVAKLFEDRAQDRMHDHPAVPKADPLR